MFLGEETLVDISKRLGITEELEAIPSLPLGTASFSMLEMLTAYGCFASSGYLNHPYFIEKVTDLNGNVLYEHTKEETLVLNPSLTFILSELLTGTYDQKMIDLYVSDCTNHCKYFNTQSFHQIWNNKHGPLVYRIQSRCRYICMDWI